MCITTNAEGEKPRARKALFHQEMLEMSMKRRDGMTTIFTLILKCDIEMHIKRHKSRRRRCRVASGARRVIATNICRAFIVS